MEKKEGSGSYAIAVANTGSDAVTYTATGLTNGNSYTFKVSAINSAAGTSAASTESQTSEYTNSTCSTHTGLRKKRHLYCLRTYIYVIICVLYMSKGRSNVIDDHSPPDVKC